MQSAQKEFIMTSDIYQELYLDARLTEKSIDDKNAIYDASNKGTILYVGRSYKTNWTDVRKHGINMIV